MVEQLEKMPSHAFLDGKIVPWNKANIHISTHCLHYGTGCYEGIGGTGTTKSSNFISIGAGTISGAPRAHRRSF